MIGLYDSGLGGLTVLRALRDAGIACEIIYFADQAHVPYGDKTDAQIFAFLSENLAFLGGLGVDAVVTACNTTCAVASRLGWPRTKFPVLDLIANASDAIALGPHRNVAVIATAATVRSHAYKTAIQERARNITVTEIAAPALVPLIEAGQLDADATRAAVAEAVAEIPPDTDAVIYGCTHYPFLDDVFAAALPRGMARIDPARAQALVASRQLKEFNALTGDNHTRYATNGDRHHFAQAITRLAGDEAPTITAFDPV